MLDELIPKAEQEVKPGLLMRQNTLNVYEYQNKGTLSDNMKT